MSLLKQGNTLLVSSQMNTIDPSLPPPSKYTATVTIPPDFPPILKEFAREVLRQQPTDIVAFAVEYFNDKVASSGLASSSRDSSGKKTAKITTEEEAAVKIQAMYRGFTTRRKNDEPTYKD